MASANANEPSNLSHEDEKALDLLAEAVERLASSASEGLRRLADMLAGTVEEFSRSIDSEASQDHVDSADAEIDRQLAALIDGSLPSASVEPAPGLETALTGGYAPNTYVLVFRQLEGVPFTNAMLDRAASEALKSLPAEIGEVSIMQKHGVGTSTASVSVVVNLNEEFPTAAAVVLSSWRGVRDIDQVGLVAAEAFPLVSELLAADPD